MKFKGTWVFSLVVAVAVGFAVWDYQKQQQNQANEEKAAQLIQDFQVGKVADFEFIGNAGRFKAMNSGGEWSIKEPIEDKADFSSLEGLLLGLAEENMTVVEVGENPDWSQYGLDKPEASLSLNMKDGTSVRIDVGSKRAYNDGYYVRKNLEDNLYLGSSSWSTYVGKTVNDMRNKDLYSGPSDYNYLEITRDGKKLAFDVVDGSWKALKNRDMLLDENKIGSYVDLLRHLRADAVVSDVASPTARKLYNLTRPAMTILVKELAQENTKDWKIELSQEKNNEVFVSIGPDLPIYRIQARKMESLKKEFSYFRDRAYPFAVNYIRVPAFRVRRQGDKKEYEFQKLEGKWMLAVEEPHMKVNEDGIDKMFNDLRGLRVKEFISGSAAEEEIKKRYGLVFLDALGDKSFEMYWADEEKVKEDKRVKVWTTLSNEVFWVDAADFKQFTSYELLVADGVSEVDSN